MSVPCYYFPPFFEKFVCIACEIRERTRPFLSTCIACMLKVLFFPKHVPTCLYNNQEPTPDMQIADILNVDMS
jgi:hypothetical protein